ncbi:hypothetical protein RB2150_16377 [Rhodobacterales bacterium HTCC2150]|nr:hypothetical protein RB2150_16377 [Rhodobacterales bacterium HTCC2150] [Rhodobacteraceae bacterium HTCC2150]
MKNESFHPDQVLDLWFPDTGHQNDVSTHGAFWNERMQGGMDAIIISDYAELTLAAATGLLDHWAETPRGRLALLIALDQFPRSLWRDTPAAYAQDIKATRLALEGIQNGDFDELAPWEQAFFVISISHCEGPDHLERMNMLTELTDRIAQKMPDSIAPMRDGFRDQTARVKKNIELFGRHPHRNAILGRHSTPAEIAYIETGDFPHVRKADELTP